MEEGVLAVAADGNFKKPLGGVTFDCLVERQDDAVQVMVFGKLLPRQLFKERYPIQVKLGKGGKEKIEGTADIVTKTIDMVVFRKPEQASKKSEKSDKPEETD